MRYISEPNRTTTFIEQQRSLNYNNSSPNYSMEVNTRGQDTEGENNWKAYLHEIFICQKSDSISRRS